MGVKSRQSDVESSNGASRALSRRGLLKGAAAVAGLAIGAKAVTGFPTVWAQDIKDIVLNHTGMSYSTIIDIAKKATEDLPFTVEMAVTDHTGMINRLVTQSKSIDVADYELWQRVQTVPRGVLQTIDINKLEHWDKMVTIYTEGQFLGKPISRQGVSPFEVMYASEKNGKKFHDGQTEHAVMVPGFYNADTLGIRPDLIERPIEHWHELFNPEFSGKAAAMDIPAIGIMDAAMAMESRGDITYADKGNMTREEIDQTIGALTDLKKQGHWRALWNTFDQSVQLMASGEVVIQSMWSPAVTAVRAQGVPCYYVPLKEGYRGWGNGLSLMGHLSGKKLGAAYDYLNWYYSGWVGAFIAKQGYYIGVPETAKKHLTENEWGYWYEGKAATDNITDPYGTTMEKPGHVRDGGSFAARFSNIACWNTLMDEAKYMLNKWAEFKAA